MITVTRLPGESTADFTARAFAINRKLCECTPGPARPFIQASPMTRAELRNNGALAGYVQAPAISRVRAIWYGSGLVFGAVCIAMAVFGMGN